MTAKDYIGKAVDLIRIEASAVAALEERIDDNFEKAVELIYKTKGKIIVTGVGKSGHIGSKIAATLSSAGTPSFFIHAYEAGHGDLGGISKNDTVILISNSGETDEVIHLVPFLKKDAVPIIGLLGSTNSTLAKKCNIVLSTQVAREADPLNMVPTASTVVTLAMGDALAIALMTKKKIDQNGFAAFHPGGSLGRRLLTTVEDLMHKSDQVPLVSAGDDVKQSLYIMTKKGFGIVGVLDKGKNLIGVITDGDLRRMLEKRSNFLNKVAKDIMSKNPKWIESNCLAIDALHLMEEHAITNLFVYTKEKVGRPIGIIHIHDILRYGILS